MIELYNAVKFVTMLFLIQKILTFNLGVAFLKFVSILQADRAALNQYAVKTTCKLCQVAPETRQHFVGECAFFKDDRRIYIEKTFNDHNPFTSCPQTNWSSYSRCVGDSHNRQN